MAAGGGRKPAGVLGGLFRSKPLDAILKDTEEPEHQLKRALGPVQLTLFGIGAIVGAGIFATIGTAAAGDLQRQGAGPALMLSFVITATVCSFTAVCYAEFAAMVPISGSAYTYAYATLGEVIAWIIGWDLIIEYAVGNIGVAVSWANYFKTFVLEAFKWKIPNWLSMDYHTAYQQVGAGQTRLISQAIASQAVVPSGPGTSLLPQALVALKVATLNAYVEQAGLLEQAPHLFGYPIIINLVAVGIVAAITLVLIWGVKESARFNAVMVSLKLIVLTFFIIIGIMWMPFTTTPWAGLSWEWPKNWSPFMPNGWTGVSAGAAVVFFAYIGFDAVSTVAEETRNPQRNLPIGIIASLIICTLFYIVVSAVFTGLISYPELKDTLNTEKAEPLTLALKHARPDSRWAVGFVAFGSVIAHTAVLLVFQLGQTRIFFAMARDGLLPPVFYKVHPRFRTPYVSTILIGILVAAFATVASIDEMVDLTNIGTLFAFILVCAGIIVLRVRDPNRPRPFRVPSGWTWTILLYACFAGGLYVLPLSEQGRYVALGIGAVCFALGRNYIFPLLGIIASLYLVYYLPPTSWLRFAAWLNLGFVIYVGYGTIHSRLTGRKYTDRPAEHDAISAYTGAWLAVVGVAMLLFMRGLDVWQERLTAHEDLSTWGRAGAALSDLFHAGPWVEVSWFLIVPLALNAFLLCPIVIRRAMTALHEGGGGRPGQVRASLGVACALTATTILYFALLAAYPAPAAPDKGKQARGATGEPAASGRALGRANAAGS
jgi:APA family basic amino acid/polyamine antiporter